MSDEEFIFTTETASADDPILHGLRWREERDRYRDALEAICDPKRVDWTAPAMYRVAFEARYGG